MKYFAVMGCPIEHSLSPLIHQQFAKQTGIQLRYEKILIDLDRFEQQVRDFFNQGGSGLNITLPCKTRAFLMSDEVTERCLQAKAANTLWQKQGKIYADNTDGIGLVRDLSKYIELLDKRILLIGAGGAARGVIGPLLQASPAQLTLTNRTLSKAFALLQDYAAHPKLDVCGLDCLIGPYDLIINATSASLKDQLLLTFRADLLTPATLCYDLAYQRDGLTSFVRYARSLHCQARDGIGMLIEQAAEAFYIWHGVRPDNLTGLTL